MREPRGAQRILAAFVAVCALATIAGAQDAAFTREYEGLRTRVELTLLFRGPEPPEPREWQSLEVAIREAAALAQQYRGNPDAETLYRRVLLLGADSFLSLRRQEDALARYETLRAYGAQTPEFVPASLKAAKISEDMAEKAPDDATKIDYYTRSRDRYTDAGDSAGAARVKNLLLEVLCREGLKLFDEQNYEASLESLTRAEGSTPEGLGDSVPGRRLKFLREETGYLTLVKVDVPVAGTPVYGSAQVDLRLAGAAADRGDRRARTFFTRLRWPHGEWNLTLSFGGDPLTLPTIRHAGPETTVEVPSQMPPGMVYVPAGGGQRPFLIDRHEVSVAQYQAFERGYKPVLGKDPKLPAHDIRFDKAQAFAKAQGKDLPTFEQWQRAAFGDDGREFPWGAGDWKGRCNLGTNKLQPVDSYAGKGESACGALNMAGNVWEWLRSGYAIGASCMQKDLAGSEFRFLRDPRPDKSRWDLMPVSDRPRYDKYKFSDEDDNYLEVGLRCVIEL